MTSSNFQCKICFDDECTSYFTLPCEHQYCSTCLKRNAGLAAKEGDLSRLVCPNEKCKLSLAAPQHMPIVKDIVGAEDYEAILAALNARTLQGFPTCPKCGVRSFLPTDTTKPHGTRIECSNKKCKFQYCSKCCSDQYHYNLPCGDEDCGTTMRKKEAAWLLFRSEALPKMVEDRAGKDAEFQKAADAFKKDQKDQARVLDAFRKDEQRKQGWVHCPHCNALWAGSDACSHVTCGVLEAKMGGQRGAVGCGKQFDLSEARKYTPIEPPPLEVVAPPSRSEGPSQPSHGIACNKCRKTICGTRFRCLHCPMYNLCLECLAKRGSSHGERRKWPNKDHIFDVIHTPCNTVQDSGNDAVINVEDDFALALQLSAAESEQDELSIALAASLTDMHTNPAEPATKRMRRSSSSRGAEEASLEAGHKSLKGLATTAMSSLASYLRA